MSASGLQTPPSSCSYISKNALGGLRLLFMWEEVYMTVLLLVPPQKRTEQ